MASEIADRRNDFVKALAALLGGRIQAAWSIGIQVQDPLALAVRDVRVATPLVGYPTVEEAERALRAFLWPVKVKAQCAICGAFIKRGVTGKCQRCGTEWSNEAGQRHGGAS